MQLFYNTTGFRLLNEPGFIQAVRLFEKNDCEMIPTIVDFLRCPKGHHAGIDRCTATGCFMSHFQEAADDGINNIRKI